MKIGLCGNIALDDLAHDLDASIPGARIIVGRTGGYASEFSPPRGEFASLDACIVAIDWRDLAPAAHFFGYGDDDRAAIADFGAACEVLGTALRSFRAVSGAKVFLFSPASECRTAAGFISRIIQPSPAELFAGFQAAFNALCRSITDVFPVDIDELIRSMGDDRARDPEQWFLRRQPFSPAMTVGVARHIAGMVIQFEKYPLKCLVLDCDNTLWGGVVGEIGMEHLVLAQDGPGRAFREFQAEIVKLHKQGTILAVCSKNNTCDALEVFERHPHMLIRPKMISCFRINWDDKPKNMLGISEELNIGLDTIMFADDSPAERAMMAAALPEVEVLQLPDNPALFAGTLKRCTRFWPIQITTDDASKGTFYAQQRLRDQAKMLAANVEEYLVKSEIVATFSPAHESTIARIAQLFNKTNQFNLTTIRYSQGQLEQMTKDPESRLFSMALRDNFGDYGIVGAALIRGHTIDSFVLSCRVFGKRAEQAFLVWILQFLKNAGRSFALGRFVPSMKNSMTKDFFKLSGFAVVNEAAGESLWRYDLAGALPEMPRWIRSVERIQDADD